MATINAFFAQDGFAVHVPPREPVTACGYCDQPLTPQNDYRNVIVAGRPARSHRYCGAVGEVPRG